MSRFTQSRTARLVAIGLLTLVGLVALPDTGHAQVVGPEQALLNSASVGHGLILVDEASPTPTSDGTRALLGQSHIDPSAPAPATKWQGTHRIITGEGALLGSVPTPPPHSRVLAR